jgi:hypothetical protein
LNDCATRNWNIEGNVTISPTAVENTSLVNFWTIDGSIIAENNSLLKSLVVEGYLEDSIILRNLSSFNFGSLGDCRRDCLLLCLECLPSRSPGAVEIRHSISMPLCGRRCRNKRCWLRIYRQYRSTKSPEAIGLFHGRNSKCQQLIVYQCAKYKNSNR